MSETVLGAQMFTVREHTKTAADLAETCRKLRQIGYQAVQVSAIGPIDPPEVARILDGEGLSCVATHVKLDLMKDTEACLDYHRTLKCEYTALGSANFKTIEEWERFAAEYSQIAATLAENGVRTGYHNHSHEWALIDGRRPIDILVEELGEEAWFEIDTYWVAHAGGDPAAWIRRIGELPGDRIPIVHVKDMQIDADRKQKMAEVGDGNLNWPAILDACGDAGVRWYLVERDSGDLDPFESLKISYENLRQMGLS